jgi:hypothetical protein
MTFSLRGSLLPQIHSDVIDSVYQRVLGERFAALSPDLRGYFSSPPDGSVGRGSGVFEVAGSRIRWLAPILRLLGWRRILFADLGHDVPFTVTNIPGPGEGLSSRREFHFPAGDRIVQDTMHVVDGSLHDFLGRRGGLEVRLAVSVVDGGLRMVSDAAWLHLRALRLPLPALLSARVTLDERWVDGMQRVDVRLRHPLLGEVFRYSGTFTYGYEPLP